MPDINDDLRNLRKSDDALDQSVGLNRILLTMIENQKRTHRWLCILLAISLVCNVLMCGIFIAYESQFVTETITTTTIEQDTDGPGNNVYQSGENAQYVQEGVTEDGETDGHDYSDNSALP